IRGEWGSGCLSGAYGASSLLLAGLCDLGLLGLGLGLALGELGKLLASPALGADADRRLLLLGLDDRQAHLAVLLGGGVDYDGRAGRDLFAQHEVGERVLDVALDRAAQRA